MTRDDDADFARAQFLTVHCRGERGRKPSAAIKSLLVAAAAACSVAALAGCEEQSYPTPSAEQAPPPAPPPPAPLMGAPSPAQPPPYAPCAENPCAPTAPTGQPTLAPHVIASTPVPNPPETEHRRHRRHSRYRTYGQAAPTATIHRHLGRTTDDGRWHVVGPASVHHHHNHTFVAAAPAAAAALAHPHHPATTRKATAASAVAPAPHKAAPPVAKAAPPPARDKIGNITDKATGAPAAETDRYNNLQAALSNLIGIDAALTTPDHFEANQTADVTLTLPANFAQQAHDEAAKARLADAAASVNINARLTGTGFTITPDQAQAQPLLLGQATVFHWKVTPTSEASGAVKADMTAELQTVGRSLPLGSVQSQAGISNIHVSGRLVGVGLLILVLVVVAGWIVSRGRTGPAFRRRDI